MGHDIFVSYSTKDKLFVDAMAHRLEEECYRCWYAPRDISAGVSWSAAISRAIRETPVMLLVFSSSSNESEEILRELALASSNKAIVIPVRIENVAPSDVLKCHLSNRHWLDVYDLETDSAINHVLEGLKNYAPVFDACGCGAEVTDASQMPPEGEQREAGLSCPEGVGAAVNTGWPVDAGNAAAQETARNAEAADAANSGILAEYASGAAAKEAGISRRFLLSAVALLLLFGLAGFLFWPSPPPVERDPSDLLVEAHPRARLFLFVTQSGKDMEVYCLRLNKDKNERKPEEYLLSMLGTGGKFDGHIVRCRVEYTDISMFFYTGPYERKQVLLSVDRTDRGVLHVPGDTREYPVILLRTSSDAARIQAFVAAFKEEQEWTGEAD